MHADAVALKLLFVGIPGRALRDPYLLSAVRPADPARGRRGRARRGSDGPPACAENQVEEDSDGTYPRPRSPGQGAARERHRAGAAPCGRRAGAMLRPVGPVWAELEALRAPSGGGRRATTESSPLQCRDPAHATFDTTRTKTLRMMRDKGWTSLGITSPTTGCGKTTVGLNLAFSLAHQPDMHTVLIDFDLRRPAMAKHIGLIQPQSMASAHRGRTARAHRKLVRVGDNLAIGTSARGIRSASEIPAARHPRAGARRTEGLRFPARHRDRRPAADAGERRRAQLSCRTSTACCSSPRPSARALTRSTSAIHFFADLGFFPSVLS